MTATIQPSENWKKDFFTIWTGQALSLLGSQLVQFAIIWYLTVETGSATVLAMVSMVALLPGVFLSPFIGALVDRWNRRRIMMTADFLIALLTLALTLLFFFDRVEVWHIYTVIFLRSIGGYFHRPAMTATTSLMVPKEHITRIQGINQTLNGGLNIISAPLGAALLAILPMHSIMMIDVVTALLAVVPLIFIMVPQPERISAENGEKPSYFQDLKEGMRYVMSWPGLLIILLMAALINFLLSPATSLLPLLVKDHFGGEAALLGSLNATLGVGVIVGGALLGAWGGFKRRVVTAMTGLIGIGVGTLIMGTIPGTAIWLAFVAFAIMGVMMPITNGSIGGIMQVVVKPEMQGRVFTLAGSLAMAMTPIGLAIAGPLSDALGIQTWFVVGGVVSALLGLIGFMIPAVMKIEERQWSAVPEEAAAVSGDAD